MPKTSCEHVVCPYFAIYSFRQSFCVCYDCSFWFQSGLMGTHDEETREFFRHSHVHCLLAPRHIDNKLSLFKQHVRTIDIPILYFKYKVVIYCVVPAHKKQNISWINYLCDESKDVHDYFSGETITYVIM